MNSLDKELNGLLENRTDGSIGLLQKFFDLIIDKSENEENCILALTRFTREFQDMQVITRFSNSFNNLSHDQIVKDCRNNLVIIRNFMDKISRSLNMKLDKQANTFLVYSNSKTIESVIQNIPEKQIQEIHIMKSIPGGEGSALFNSLRNNGKLRSKLRLIDDDEGLALIDQQEINYLLLGCDQFHDTWFVNKIGTGRLAKKATDNKVPVFLLTQKWKKSISADHPIVKSELLELVNLIDEINIITD